MRAIGQSLQHIAAEHLAGDALRKAKLDETPARLRGDGFDGVKAKQQPVPPKLDPTTARILATTQELIRIPSQGGIDDPAAICNGVLLALAEAGLKGELLLSQGQPVGVVAEVKGAHAGPTYVLNAVVDTAPVGEATHWSAKPFSAELRGNQLIGRGAGDSKAAAAIFIEVGRKLASQTDAMHGRALLFFDAAEHTGEFQGVRTFIAEHCKVRPNGMLIGYPGNESLQIGSRGFTRRAWTMALPHEGSVSATVKALAAPASVTMPEGRSIAFPLDAKLTATAVRSDAGRAVTEPGMVFELQINGKSAHSGSSGSAGTNAITKAGSFLASLQEHGTALFGDSFSATVLGIEGGKEFSQIPDSVRVKVFIPESSTTALRAEHVVRTALNITDDNAPSPQPSVIAKRGPNDGSSHALAALTLNIDVRTTLMFDEDQAVEHLAKCEAWATEAGLASSYVDREAWPAFRLPENSPLQTAMMNAIGAAGLAKVQARISGPSNAGNVAAAYGIPATAGFGVSCKHAHGTNESINVATIPTALRVYTEAMQKLFGISAAV